MYRVTLHAASITVSLALLLVLPIGKFWNCHGLAQTLLPTPEEGLPGRRIGAGTRSYEPLLLNTQHSVFVS